MKSNFLRKAKWYVIGFILVAIMLSVSLSFCSWDKMSLQAKVGNSSGWYTEKPTKYVLASDNNKNGIADVGDIVTFGKYYQSITEDGNIEEKTPIRWIVVDKINNQLTLLAEKIMAFGSFWGTWYNDGTSKIYNEAWGAGWNWETQQNGIQYQNYSLSTLRAWLNSYYNLRNDAGVPFSQTNNEARFRGFLSEAFSADEQVLIIPKTMSGIKGCGIDGKNPSLPTSEYASIIDKVWVPSWSELFGTQTTNDGVTLDGSPNKRFSYFSDTNYTLKNEKLIAKTTDFASTPQFSNYTSINTKHIQNAQSTSGGMSVWWWLRSPSSLKYCPAHVIGFDGYGTSIYTDQSRGGVRPAIIIPV